MLYVCLPTYNEAVTVGVLLWRLRTMLREQAGGRDYEIVVYDDASTDATPDVLAPYARVLPLTILRGEAHGGQSAAVDALVRHVVARSRTPDTDALVLLQADYTDAPELLPALLAPFDAGADLVLTSRPPAPDQPLGERRLRQTASVLLPPLLRAAVRDAAARDPGAILNLLRLFRVSVLRDALDAAGGAPLVTAAGRAGTAELAVRSAPYAPRIARVEVPAHAGVRTRPSRLDWTREMRAIAALLWQQRRRAGRQAPRPADATGSHPPSVSPRMAPTLDDPPDLTSEAAPAVADVPRLSDAPDAADPTAPTKSSRRRRRGRRGRQAAGGAALDDASFNDITPNEVAPEDPTVANDSADATSDDDPAALPDTTSAGPPGTDPGGPAKRRRRRGGARRRTQGPDRDTGVGPDDTGADSATWQGAPSDQPSS